MLAALTPSSMPQQMDALGIHEHAARLGLGPLLLRHLLSCLSSGVKVVASSIMCPFA